MSIQRIILIFLFLLAVSPLPLWAQEGDNAPALDFSPEIAPDREVIKIESGKYKLETDILNREMESAIKESRPDWKGKPAVLTSDESVSKSQRKEYLRKKQRLEKHPSKKEDDGDSGSGQSITEKGPLDLLDLEGLARTRPRNYGQEPLSIKERMARAKKEEATLKRTLKALKSDKGQLKLLVEREPLKNHQEKIVDISTKIKKLKQELNQQSPPNSNLFLEMGRAYMESQAYLESVKPKDRLRLIRYAEYTGTILGSYELAIWAFKQAATYQPENGEAHLLLSEVYEKLDNPQAAQQHAHFAQRLSASEGQ